MTWILGMLLASGPHLGAGASGTISGLREHLRVAGGDAQGWYELGQAYAAEAQHQSAADAFRLSLSHGLADARCHCALALSLRETSKARAAWAEARRCLQELPGYARGWNLLGNIECDLGNLDSALKAYESAVRLQPDYANAHYNLGLLLARLNRDQESLKAFQSARRLNSGDADTALGLARAWRALGKPELARLEEKAYRKLMRQSDERR